MCFEIGISENSSPNLDDESHGYANIEAAEPNEHQIENDDGEWEVTSGTEAPNFMTSTPRPTANAPRHIPLFNFSLTFAPLPESHTERVTTV